MVSTLEIDGEIETTALLTVEEVEALSMLEPYGAGNPKPVFSLSGATDHLPVRRGAADAT